MPKRRKKFDQTLASTVESLAATTDRQSSMIERLFGALARMLPVARSSLPENIEAESSPVEPEPLGEFDSELAALTARELEVARLICQGITSKVIAERFVVSEGTIKKHRSNIKGKIGTSDRAGLEAIRERWDTRP